MKLTRKTTFVIFLLLSIILLGLSSCTKDNEDTNNSQDTENVSSDNIKVSVSGKAYFQNFDNHEGIQIDLKNNQDLDTIAYQASTDTTGNYLFSEVHSGNYQLSVSNLDSTEKIRTISISVSERNLKVVNMVLTAAGSIQGKINLDGKTGHRGTLIFLEGTSHVAYTDSEGEYLITNIPVGSYRLSAFHNGYKIDSNTLINVVSGISDVDLIDLAVDVSAANYENLIEFATFEGSQNGCSYGGQEIKTGKDDGLNIEGQSAGEANDGTLADGEVDKTSYLCNGQNGVAGEVGASGLTTLVSNSVEPIGGDCANGGIKQEKGLDSNQDGTLQPTEVTSTNFICNGISGEQGIAGLTTLFLSSAEIAGDNCVNGGVKQESGLDINEDGTLQPTEVTSTSFICDGTPGAQGIAGNNGLTTLFISSAENAGDNCINGGVKQESGIDNNEDGSLQLAEVTTTNFLCNGATGTTGSQGVAGLVALSAEAPGNNCIVGGTKIDSGVDTNANNLLDFVEIQNTSYVCNSLTNGLWVTPISGNTTEAGGEATFTVRLFSQPSADVVVNIISTDVTEGVVDKPSLVFTSTNWNNPQTVTVHGVDDLILDADIQFNIRIGQTTSADPNFNLTFNYVNLLVVNENDEVFGFNISETSGDTSEWSRTTTFMVQLASTPTADVTLPLISGDVSEGTISPTSLTFTPTEWNVPQTVTITGVDDQLFDGDINYQIITGFSSSIDPNYNNLNPADINVKNIENDFKIKVPDTGQTTSYTAAIGEDVDYSINPHSYTDHLNGTITDNVTGLTWQQNGSQSSGTKSVAEYCSDSSLAGHLDWRQPTLWELITIFDFGQSASPRINRTAFLQISTGSSNYLAENGSVRFGYYNYSYISWTNDYSNSAGGTLCVRGNKIKTGMVFTDNLDGTVRDDITGLIWQQSEGGSHTWEEALSYCENLPLGEQNNWRLPNHNELLSLANLTPSGPTINSEYFPVAFPSNYWTSTTVAFSPSEAWNIGFNDNQVEKGVNKTASAYVRCVLGGDAASGYMPIPKSTNVLINADAATTNITTVSLDLTAKDDIGVVAYFASETNTKPLLSDPEWIIVSSAANFSATVDFSLSDGKGIKTVYVWYKDGADNISTVTSDTIELNYTFTSNTDGTITQSDGLVWQTATAADTYDWSRAITYCTDNTAALPGTGWRLPSKEEWINILDITQIDPKVAPIFNATTVSGYYWTSSTGGSYRYYVDTATGRIDSWGSSNTFNVRCVRDPDSDGPQLPAITIQNPGASFQVTNTREVTLDLLAADDVAVTGYYRSESNLKPTATAAEWIDVTPVAHYIKTVDFTLYTAGEGTKTVYVWFKDAEGNISKMASDSIILSTSGFLDNDDGTISELNGELIWAKGVVPNNLTWSYADSYCVDNTEELPGTGWRLPTRSELSKLVDSSQPINNVKIDTIFNISNSRKYWTSTPYPFIFSSNKWVVDFGSGSSVVYEETYPVSVRCVRGGR